jgi:AraC-like DNA-binding protein
LISSAVEILEEPALALLFGEATRMQHISAVGVVGECSGTIGDARQRLNRYARLSLDAGDRETSDRIQFIREGDDLWLWSSTVLYLECPYLVETNFAQCVLGAREMFGPDWPYPKAIRFAHSEPAYRAEYDRIFGVPLYFGSGMNALLMDDAVMSIKLPRTNPYFSGVLNDHAEKLLKSLDNSKSERGRVESVLVPMLHTGSATVDAVAAKLGLSRQTLFRRLKGEGVTFEIVLDELRHRLAIHYLTKEKSSVSETSYLLGFSEPAAFSRAFKRWTGSYPGSLLKTATGKKAANRTSSLT